jgi:hypothetical protein
MSNHSTTASELESTYDSLHSQIQDASHELREIENLCRTHHLTACVEQIEQLVLGHTIMYRTRERDGTNCIEDCISKASPGTQISNLRNLKDPKAIENFEECRRGCIESAIAKMQGETDMLKRAYYDLRVNYLDKIPS